MAGDLNLPFEEQDETRLDLSDALLSGGVVVMGATIPDGNGRLYPAVVFRFARHDGTGFHPPVVLACDNPAHLHAMPELVDAAVHAALRRAGG